MTQKKKMASLDVLQDSFNGAKNYLYEYLMNRNINGRINCQIIEKILQKHPDLVNWEYRQEVCETYLGQVNFGMIPGTAYKGTPLLLACEKHCHGEGKFPSG